MNEKILLKLDFGCGPRKREGFIGVDAHHFVGVDYVMNLAEPKYAPLPKKYADLANLMQRKVIGYKPWPWADGSVAEAHASHFVEHLGSMERIHFVNELYRILVPRGTCQIIVPHWASCRAYGDPTHKWSAVSEFWFFYLSKEWRTANAPHTDALALPGGFTCDFEAAWGYSMRPDLALRNQEYQQFAMSNYKEACMDLIATLTRKA